MRPDPDIDLLPGLQAGETAALSQLMDRHLNQIHALAWHMLGERSLAEDVAQETFLRLWQAAPRWTAQKNKSQATLLTWMRRVATRICIDEKRKHAPIYTDSLPETIDIERSAEAKLSQNETASQVQQALLALPARQRAAITLSYYQELTQREGAAILGLKEKAYESLLSRARLNLKTSLQPKKASLLL